MITSVDDSLPSTSRAAHQQLNNKKTSSFRESKNLQHHEANILRRS
jgi:hypothetical protein